ncbi:ATP-binding protein [Cognatishimia sp. D5M38]|uniref:histidine kinase n=1 Tax=Cognatishimia coralii TaxID=3083254 RepID=A0ABU8QH20_9RHOB
MPRKTLNTSSSFRQGFGWAPIYVATSLIGILVAGAILYFVEQRNRSEYESEMRSKLQYDLNQAALDLSLVFQRNADTIRSVAALISIEPDISFERFSEFSEKIFVDHNDFLQIAAAPDLVVDRVYPNTLADGLLGLDYRAPGNEELMGHVLRARKAQSVLFSGPVDLFHGGQGVIGHNVVYLDDANGEPQFWGLINLVIDYEEELHILGLDDVPYRLAIRGKDARGSHGAIFWGDRSTFAADPVFATVNLPVGSWVMAAAPTGGWHNYSVSVTRFYGIVAGTTLIVILLLSAATRLVQLRIRAVAQMSSAINSIQDGFAYYNSDDRLVACNEKYRDFHGGASKLFTAGTRFEDILRSGVSRGHYAEAIGNEEEWLQNRLAQHRASEGAVDQKLDDGRWVRMSESRTPDGGTVGFLMDITELMNAKEEAERANLAKSEFLDVMSHELRTPLTVVLGGTPFLVKPELLPATQKVTSRLASMGDEAAPIAKDVDTMLTSYKSLAGKVERSAKSLLTLINEVLDYSKIEAGRMKLAREMTYCDEIIEDVVEEYRNKAAEKGLTIETESPELAIYADEPRVRQVLENLVSNAIKFTEDGSVRVQAQTFGDFARFRVIDTGIGIPADRVDGIFEKFSQANTSDRRRAGGTGLGLAISKKFVEMHGGTIAVTSREGDGSEFSFTIPKHMVQKSRAHIEQRAKPAA